MSGPPVPPELEGWACWILGPDGRTPVTVPIPEGIEWMNAYGSVRVAFDEGPWGEVSTVFLPRMEPSGVFPDLFETRIRWPGGRDATEPAATWDEAEGNHAGAVAALCRPDTGPTGLPH